VKVIGLSGKKRAGRCINNVQPDSYLIRGSPPVLFSIPEAKFDDFTQASGGETDAGVGCAVVDS
jgi:hypothetical protein